MIYGRLEGWPTHLELFVTSTSRTTSVHGVVVGIHVVGVPCEGRLW